MTVVRETEKRIVNLQETNRAIEMPTAERPLAPANLDEQVESMIDLITLALWTDSTRVASLILTNTLSEANFSFIDGVTESFGVGGISSLRA